MKWESGETIRTCRSLFSWLHRRISLHPVLGTCNFTIWPSRFLLLNCPERQHLVHLDRSRFARHCYPHMAPCYSGTKQSTTYGRCLLCRYRKLLVPLSRYPAVLNKIFSMNYYKDESDHLTGNVLQMLKSNTHGSDGCCIQLS